MLDSRGGRLINETGGDLLERLIESVLGVLLAFMPLALGVVQAWSEQVLFCLIGILCLLTLLRWMLIPQQNVVRSWLYVPLVLVLLIGFFQLLPLPAALLAKFSPHTAALKMQYLGDLPQAETLLSKMCLTFYPQGTIRELRLLWAVIAVFVVVLNTYRRPEIIKRLLTTIAVIGGCFAILAILQTISRTDKIYWIFQSPNRLADAGPFVNHSHFSQFMNLSLGAALARLLIELQERFRSHGDISVRDVADYLGSPQGVLLWTLTAVLVLGATSVFLSLSRGGMISLLVAGSFTMVLLTLKQGGHGRGKLMAVMALVAFVCILYIGFDAVYERLGSLQDIDRAEGGRWQIVKDIALAWTRFPLFGTGLGTHQVVYPMFDRSTIRALAGYAENEYAQTLEETGIVGFVLLMTWLTAVWYAYGKSLRHLHKPIQMATFGIGFGLLAITLHSFSDFGQHLPANATLTAIFGALMLTLARPGMSERGQRGTQEVQVQPGRLATGAVALLLGSSLWIWMVVGANSARVGEAHWHAAQKIEEYLEKNQWQGADEHFIDLLAQAQAAASAQPRNIHYRHWLNVYRWRTISRIKDPNTGGILLMPETMEFTRQIIDELHQARWLCPTYGPTLCMIGQLEQIVFEDPNGIKHIRQGFALAPCDPIACYMAALVDMDEGLVAEAQSKLKRAIDLSPQLYEEIAAYCIYQQQNSPLALMLAENNIGHLSRLASLLSQNEDESETLQRVRTQIADVLGEECAKEDTNASYFAALARLQRRNGDLETSLINYEKALVRSYNNVYWHYELARLLAEQERIEKAIHEARICLRLRSDFEPAKQLIAKLSVHPEALSESDAPQ